MKLRHPGVTRFIFALLASCCAIPALVAADKNGVSPSSISLPRGPGSIEGLGESFQPSLNTGTAKYGIGIDLPPGTAGHQPALALSYDGGGANGPLGYGWSLSLPLVQRRTDKGIPTYGQDPGVNRPDTFINEAREELVPQADGFFFPETQTDFFRYRKVEDHWEATSPDGTRFEFGPTPASRIVDPATGETFCWLLARQTDTRGNVIEYVHSSFPGEQNTNQKYLSEIRYGPGSPPWTHFHFVTLQYEDRNDWFEDCRSGFPVRTGKRLKSIIVGTQGTELASHLAGDFNGDDIPDHLNRRYDIAYLSYAGTNSHWSLLESVTMSGADGITALPPARFTYAVSDPPEFLSAAEAAWESLNEPVAVMDNDLVELIDLNADGLPDILRTESGGGAHSASLNKGPVLHEGKWKIQWADPVAVDPGTGTAWNFDLASESTHLADMNGDGLADLVHKTIDDAVFYFANSGQVSWGARADMAMADVAPPAPFGNPSVRTADIDFDKRIDVVQSIDLGGSIAYRTWLNLAEKGYAAPITLTAEGGFDFASPDVQIADGNGDRVPDVARIRPTAVLLAAGLGYGRFMEPRPLVLPDITLDDNQLEQARLADINGDGLADLIVERPVPGECWYWLNLGNYTLSPRRVLTDLPTLSSEAATRWADLNGNGTTDLVYADSAATPRLQLLEIGHLVSGGLAPNLLTSIDNGIGRVTRIEYAPSTRFSLEDAAAGRPWPDAVPFPVTVVSRVAVSDSLGHEYATEFRYHDGYYDPEEKQFRGFAHVEQIDIGDPSAPTLVTRSYFDTGRDFESMKGQLLRTSAETTEGAVFRAETTTWALPPRTVAVGTNGTAVSFAHPMASVKEILELGRGTPRRIESEFDYDDYGNQTRVAHYGVVEEGDRSAMDDERISLTQFAINTNAWILRLPKSQVIQDENGMVIGRTEWFYDDETFSGSNPGAVTLGNLTLRRDWIDPADPAAWVASTRMRYDAYGNVVATLDPLSADTPDPAAGHFREMAYDEAFHTHVTLETIHVGNGTEPLLYAATHDPGLAIILTTADFNANVTTFEYDALARLVRIFKPGDIPDYPSGEFEYVLGAPAEYWSATDLQMRTGKVNYVETRQLDREPAPGANKADAYLISRQFTDGLGRTLMTRTEAEPLEGSTTPRVVVTGATLFNARQSAHSAISPHFSTLTGSLEEILRFENIENPGWTGEFHENGSLVARDLASAHQTVTHYDATLRAVRVINPDGSTHLTEHEPLLVRLLDENDNDPTSPHFGTPMVHTSDGLGRLIQVDEVVRLSDDGTPSGQTRTWSTRYAYDLNDRLVAITDSQNNTKLMRYDGLRRKVWMSDPDTGITTNIYDAASNLIETTDAKGQRTTYAYDGVNRILHEDYHDDESSEFSYRRSPDVTYRYDTAVTSVDAGDGTRVTARNVRGKLTAVEDASGEEHTSYDHRGRVEWTIKRIPDQLPGDAPSGATTASYRTRLAYDPADRIVGMEYPDNDSVAYEYNERGLLQRIVGSAGVSVVSGVSYSPAGQQTRVSYGNGIETLRDYDLRSRLARIITRQSATQSELIHLAYEFDPASNVRAIDDQRSELNLPSADPRRQNQAYAYDELYRLSRVEYSRLSVPSGDPASIAYRYDRIGNMLAQTSTLTNLTANGLPISNLGQMQFGGAGGAWDRNGLERTGPGPHALTAIQQEEVSVREFEYDANGNMTHIDGLNCRWDFKNRLVRIEDEEVLADYRYDFADRRVSKRVMLKTSEGGAATNRAEVTLYIGKHFEIRKHDQPTKFVFHGATRVARITGSLSTSPRIQRLRLRQGWNLVSLAVAATHVLQQIRQDAGDPDPNVGAIHVWDQETLGYRALGDGDDLPAGSVLWIRALTNSVVSVIGTYSDPAQRTIPGGGTFVGGAGLEAWSPTIPAECVTWAYDPTAANWRGGTGGELSFMNEFPAVLAPGEAFYVHSDEPVELAPPDPTLRIRYYHQDHLGSSSVVTDAEGNLIEEIAFHPFGEVRHAHQPRGIADEYQFTQKERDEESGLQYFETRYLASSVSRFMTPDPKFAHPDLLADSERTAFLARPQKLNLYSYVLNNPVNYADPSGLDEKEVVDQAVSATGFAADVADGFASGGFLVDKTDDLAAAVAKGNALGIVAKTAGTAANVVGVTMKTAQFINDPTEHNAAQALWEADKWALTALCAPVGLIFQGLDLAGVGPSAFFEATEKSIQANRAAAKAYRQTAKIYRETTEMINNAIPGIQAKHQEAARGVQKLNKIAADIREDTKRLQDDVRKAEAKLARQKAELRYWQARARKAQEQQ